MGKNVNFKFVAYDGQIHHCFSLQAMCERNFDHSEKIIYFVEALSFEKNVPMLISPIYDSPEEALEFIDKTAKKYPRYGDKRDFDISFAPEYEENNELFADQSEDGMEL